MLIALTLFACFDSTLIEFNGVSLEVPTGAVPDDVSLGVHHLSEVPLPLPEGHNVAGAIVELTPHGVEFSAPVTVSLPAEPEATGVLTLSGPEDTTWEPVAEVRFEGGKAVFDVDHFSYFVPTSSPLTDTGFTINLDTAADSGFASDSGGSDTGTGSGDTGPSTGGDSGEAFDYIWYGQATVSPSAWTGFETFTAVDASGSLLCEWTYDAVGTPWTGRPCVDYDGNACDYTFEVEFGQPQATAGACGAFREPTFNGTVGYAVHPNWSNGGINYGPVIAYYAPDYWPGVDWLPLGTYTEFNNNVIRYSWDPLP